MKPSIFIATPTHGGTVTVDYHSSVTATIIALARNGIGVEGRTIDAANLPMQRDALVHHFLDHTPSTHILFIDSDMKVPASLAKEYLDLKKPFVAAIYPRRKVDMDKLRAEVKATSDLDLAMSRTLDFVAKAGPKISGQGHFASIDGVGMGFAMISRECFDIMHKSGSIRQYFNRLVGKPVTAYFEEIESDDGKLSEDFSFCKRWRDTGGEIFADVSSRVGHVGSFIYTGSFQEYLNKAVGK